MHKYLSTICLILFILILSFLPRFLPSYLMAIFLSLFMYTILVYSWSLFSGSTGYISLATASFFGIGAYTMALFAGKMPVPVILIFAFIFSFCLAFLIGLSTLRLKGMYFVVFTFGLSELFHQLVTWWEVNISGTVGRWVVPVLRGIEAYYYLLFLAILIFMLYHFVLNYTSLGFSLKVIGQDEEVAAHIGNNTTIVKVLGFALTASFIGVVGAVMAPRWTYIDPHIAFNPMISFTVIIMALLGGATKSYGPLMGVIPIVLLSELLQTRFPYYYMLILGIFFVFVIYFLDHGLVGLINSLTKARRGFNEPYKAS